MFNGKSFHEVDGVKDKECAVCGTFFTPRSGVHKFCSATCKGKWKYLTGQVSTESQYANISGDWERYVSRLIYCGGQKRKHLSKDIILRKLKEQDYRCAISGVALTCNLEKGKKFPTNVSIDRIEAGGPYIEDNIQLVCRALNSWRADLSTKEFVEWCRLVVEYNDIEKEGS